MGNFKEKGVRTFNPEGVEATAFPPLHRISYGVIDIEPLRGFKFKWANLLSIKEGLTHGLAYELTPAGLDC